MDSAPRGIWPASCARGRGEGSDILVIDKSGIAADASGLACGIVRHNDFQPAMRELMAHGVDLWESDPAAFRFRPVGYMQISPGGSDTDAWASASTKAPVSSRSSPAAPQ